MSINISVHGSPVSIRRKKLFISDIETLKKNEINRRRRLRLEQVRQQSKDIASQIRQRVRGERDRQLSDLEEKQRAELNKQQAQRLLKLQQQYQDCLEEIGVGHLEAALEPDPEIILEAERRRIHALAEERGREATTQLRKDLAEAEEKKNAARKQQQFSRTVENLRSAVIVSLGKSIKRTPKKRKGKKKKKKPQIESSDNVPAQQQQQLHHPYPPPPPESWTVPLIEVPELQRVDDETDFKKTTVPTAPALSEAVETSDNSSESSSEDNLINSESSSSSSSSSSILTGGTDLRVQQSRVRFYDHGNRHEREYEGSALVERIDPYSSELDANKAAEIESQKLSGAVTGQTSYTRTYDRGYQALARERVHKDYKQLLGDLHTLAREERLIRSTREHGLPPEVFYEDYRRKEFDNRRQRNMDSAFESIYYRTQMDSPSVPESSPDTTPGQPQWEPADQDDTPAKLNVADYHQKSPLVTINVHSATAQGYDSITSAPPDKKNYSEQASCVCATLDHKAGPSISAESDASTTAKPGIAAPDVTATSGQKTAHDHVSDPVPNFSMATGQATSTEPASSGYRLDSLEELMERVKAQQALLLDEIRFRSETLESHQPVQEQPDAADESNRKHLHHSKENLEISQDTADAEEKPNETLGDESDSEGKSADARQATIHEKKKGDLSKCTKAMKPRTICKCKERNRRKKEEKTQGIGDKIICKSDTSGKDDSKAQLTEVHSEYSYEHSIVESSNASGSTSYEGVKIVVSVSELSERMYRSAQGAKGKRVVCTKSPQKMFKHHDNRKICKRRHKTPEEQLIEPERESHVDKDSKYKSPRKQRKQENITRDVREKGTMTTDFELPLLEGNSYGRHIPHASKERETSGEKVRQTSSQKDDSRKDGDKRWENVLEKSTTAKKNSSDSTSYMSPPEQLISSNIEHLASLLARVKEHQGKEDIMKTQKMNPLLIHYISRLLTMSRESVENLGMSTSDISTPDIESSSGENVSMNVQGPRSRQDRTNESSNGNVTDDPFKNMRQQTGTLPYSCKAPCSGQVQHVPGTSTPQEEEEPDQPTKSKTKDDQRLIDITTPPFESRLKDMTLEEYKAMKFPDIFPEYSERCSRISNLAKRIQQIRNEQKRLMSNISGSSSSSGSGQDYDSTKYISPPESITIMTRLGSIPQSKPMQSATATIGGKENIPHTSRQCDDKSCTVCHDGTVREVQNGARLKQLSNGAVKSSESFYSTPPESTTVLHNNKQRNIASSNHISALNQALDLRSQYLPTASRENGLPLRVGRPTTPQSSHSVDQTNQDMSDLISGTYQQGVCGLCPQDNGRRCHPDKCLISREPRSHTRPPSTSLRRNFPSDMNNVPIKELSTIIEGDSTLTSIGSNKEREKNLSHADTSDDSMPDVLSEMLSRRLITSPPPWLQTEENVSSSPTPDSSSRSPRNTQNSSGSDSFKEANFFTYMEQNTEELSQMLREGFKNISKVDLPRLIIDIFSRLGKNPSEIDLDHAFMKLGLRWLLNNGDQITRPHLALQRLAVTTKAFCDQVYKFFKGLTLDSPLEDLENAFRKIGITCPDASLKRNGNGKSVSFSLSMVGNSSDSYDASTSTGSALLPPIPTSISVSSEDLSISQDIEPSSENK